jgi:hypothetical protein
VSAELAGWIPIRAYWDGGRFMLDWCRAGDVRFSEPFFEQTVRRMVRRPFNAAFRVQTPIAVLDEMASRRPGLQPNGLIFHLSRSGSTLVSRMFAALPRTLTISEAPPIDAVLQAARTDPSVSDEERIGWLRGLVSALGQPRAGDEERYVIKLDAWHTRDLELFERAFPGVPWAFVYRDPLEVLASHRGGMSYLMSAANAGPALDLDAAAAYRLEPDDYRARVLTRICSAVLAQRPEPARLVAYPELPAAVWEQLAALFGMQLDEGDVAAMEHAAHFDAKRPDRIFASDADEKRRVATTLEGAWLAPLRRAYAELERVRTSVAR